MFYGELFFCLIFCAIQDVTRTPKEVTGGSPKVLFQKILFILLERRTRTLNGYGPEGRRIYMASSRSFWCLRRGHPNQRKLSNHLGFGPNIEVRPGCWASCPDTCESDVGSRSQDVPRVCFKIQSMCARRYADRCVSSKVQYHGQEDIINIATVFMINLLIHLGMSQMDWPTLDNVYVKCFPVLCKCAWLAITSSFASHVAMTMRNGHCFQMHCAFDVISTKSQ